MRLECQMETRPRRHGTSMRCVIHGRRDALQAGSLHKPFFIGIFGPTEKDITCIGHWASRTFGNERMDRVQTSPSPKRRKGGAS